MLYDISDVCTLFDLTPSGVRFYEEAGLIHPSRTESGRRKYEEEELRRLLLIKGYRSCGIGLDEIGGHFLHSGSATSAETCALLEEKIKDIEKQELLLRAAKKKLTDHMQQMKAVDLPDHGLTRVDVPPFYLLSLSPLFGKKGQEARRLAQWIALCPSMTRHIEYVLRDGKIISKRDCFCVDRDLADMAGLPLREQAEQRSGGTALKTCRQVEHKGVHGMTETEIYDTVEEVTPHLSSGNLRIFIRFLFGNKVDGADKKAYDVVIFEEKQG